MHHLGFQDAGGIGSHFNLCALASHVLQKFRPFHGRIAPTASVDLQTAVLTAAVFLAIPVGLLGNREEGDGIVMASGAITFHRTDLSSGLSPSPKTAFSVEAVTFS